MTTRTLLSAALVSMAMAWGCGDDDSAATTVCSPGDVKACPCPGGQPDGTQVCNDDGSAWEECDCGGTDGDADADSDGDTDTDTDVLPPMTDCDGGKLDPTTSLCWQDPPGVDKTNWYRASGTYNVIHNPDSEDFCGDLVHGGHSDWRLPDIDELISLLRGCVHGTHFEYGDATGDLSPSDCEMSPTGCVAAGSCSGVGNCNYCYLGHGPGAGGCYWDPALGTGCEAYWSSTSTTGSSNDGAWIAWFRYGDVYQGHTHDNNSVRCVRGGP